MFANIIVAVACNLVAALILIAGIIKSVHSGVKVTLINLLLTAGAAVGTYFLTPILTGLIWKLEGLEALLTAVNISVASVNSCVFLIVFLAFVGINSIICSIVKAVSIAKFRKQHTNTLKMKRAKAINPRGEAAIARAEKRDAVARYRASIHGVSKFFAVIFGAITAVIIGFAILMPFGFIGKDIDMSHDTPYLVEGFNYTLNGVVGEDIAEKIIQTEWVETKKPDVQPEVETE